MMMIFDMNICIGVVFILIYLKYYLNWWFKLFYLIFYGVIELGEDIVCVKIVSYYEFKIILK